MERAAALGWPVLIMNDVLHLRYPSLTSRCSSEMVKLPNTVELQSNDITSQLRMKIMMLPEEYRLVRLAIETKMNLTFSLQCLRENGFDYHRALANFEEVRSRQLLPLEAFQEEVVS
jgi:nuclear RNA export factor